MHVNLRNLNTQIYFQNDSFQKISKFFRNNSLQIKQVKNETKVKRCESSTRAINGYQKAKKTWAISQEHDQNSLQSQSHGQQPELTIKEKQNHEQNNKKQGNWIC